MKSAVKKTKLALLAAIALAFVYLSVISVCADTESSMPKPVSIDSDKFLFINAHTNKNGVGEVDGFMYIDFPTYSYNSEVKILTSRVPIKNFDDTTKFIMGTGLSISGTAGSGASTILTAYSTTFEEDSFYVDPDYTIHIFYGNEWATVKVGETWEKVVEEKSPVGTGKYVFTYTVKNFGLLDKSNFHQPTPQPTPTSVPTVTPTPTNTPTPTPTPTPLNDIKPVSIDPDKFLFIDTHKNKRGIGEVDGYMFIDFPTYSYNFETKSLSSWLSINNFDDTTKLIMGSGMSLSGTAGSGAGTTLTAYSTTFKEDSFYVDPDYTIHIFYANEWATVKVGETWQKVVEEKPQTGTGKYEITYTVKNLGLFEKSRLQQPTPVPTPTSVPTATPTPTDAPTPLNERGISGFIASDIPGITDHSGFKVEIENYSDSAYTDENGSFSFKAINMPSGQYTIIISKPGYLTRKINLNLEYEDLEFGSEIDPVVMLSGDANKDNAVNMSDAILIARLFNKTPSDSTFNPAADFNMDGVINVADVVCVAKNFNITADSYKQPTIYRSYHIDATPGEEICIPLSEGGIAGITYRFAIEDEELVNFISKASQSVPYPDALIETYWTFKALKSGKTTITFTSRFYIYKFYIDILG